MPSAVWRVSKKNWCCSVLLAGYSHVLLHTTSTARLEQRRLLNVSTKLRVLPLSPTVLYALCSLWLLALLVAGGMMFGRLTALISATTPLRCPPALLCPCVARCCPPALLCPCVALCWLLMNVCYSCWLLMDVCYSCWLCYCALLLFAQRNHPRSARSSVLRWLNWKH